MENCQQQIKIIMVSWNKPIVGTYKLNTDGSTIHNTGKTGGGGILRDHQGNLIYAFAIPIDFGANNFAEIQAALYGLSWCVQHGYKQSSRFKNLVTKWSIFNVNISIEKLMARLIC